MVLQTFGWKKRSELVVQAIVVHTNYHKAIKRQICPSDLLNVILHRPSGAKAKMLTKGE